jgi:hypothetical protein
MEEINQAAKAALPANGNMAPVPAPAPANASLSPEQQKFVNKWSFGAFSLSFIYFFASGLIKQGLLLLIPFYNIYVYFKGIVKGRKMSWEKGEWKDFDTFQRRQKLLDRIGLVMIIFMVVFFTAISFFVLGALKAPTQAADNFMDDLVAGQVQSAYNLTSSKLQASATADEFQQMVSSDSSGLSQIQSYKFSSRSSEDSNGTSKAVMVGTETLKDGRTTPLEVDLVQENGAWKIGYLATGSDVSNSPEQ